jgi:hypothetical protein
LISVLNQNNSIYKLLLFLRISFHIVTCRPISRQRSKYEHATIVFSMCSAEQRANRHAFWEQERCFLCGPCHSQCWGTDQWTHILTCDTYFPWGPARGYIKRNTMWAVGRSTRRRS